MSDLIKIKDFYEKLYKYISVNYKAKHLIDLRNKYSKVNVESKHNKVMVMPTSKIHPYIKGVKLLICFEEGRCGFMVENPNLLISSIVPELSFDLKIEQMKNKYFIWWKTPIINLEKDFELQEKEIDYLLESVVLKIRFYRRSFGLVLYNNW